MRYFALPLLLLTLACASLNVSLAGDATARLSVDNLAATQQAVRQLQAESRPVDLKMPYEDTRAILHSHSLLSHDSRSPIDEILAAARETGVRVIMFTEHPADHYDYFTDGHQGLRDGVLLIPGAETNGFHAYPTRSIQKEKTETPQEFADLVRRDDGLVFLCHLEERMDWNIDGLTGTEIYNTHADLKDEKKLLASMQSPIGLLALLPACTRYPQEFFAALQDYPIDYLRRYDELCLTRPHTGVAGNDSHHNMGVRAVLQENGKVLVEDRLGEKLAELDPEKILVLRPMIKGKSAGETVVELDLDPYERNFGFVSTHLLLTELSQPAVWEALKAGRAYVAFDWIADPTGFAYVARAGGKDYPMGSEPKFESGMKLLAEAPVPGVFKVVRNGEVVHEARTRKLEYPLDQPGNYRLEVWENIVGELRPWILTNPIYVRGS